jgi:hypothetical protein
MDFRQPDETAAEAIRLPLIFDSLHCIALLGKAQRLLLFANAVEKVITITVAQRVGLL